MKVFATTQRRRSVVVSISVAAAAAVLLTVTGAFTTDAERLHERLIHWLLALGTGSAWGQLCQHLLQRRVALAGRPWLHIGALSLVVAGPMCVFICGATGLFFHGEFFPIADLPRFALYVGTVAAAVCALVVLLGRATPVQTHASATATATAKFTERLPLRLRAARLIAVAAEDHYLRVHTEFGSDLILMRFSDALTELEGIEGSQTHRSWWLARDAVRGASRGGGRATLLLDGGVTAPVSRRYAAALREERWF